MDNIQYGFGLLDYHAEQGRLVLLFPTFDFDSFGPMGDQMVQLLSATVVEKQQDADIHSWLIDFEGCQLFLKAEHYSESVWLEALIPAQSKQECDYLAALFQRGF
jgi:hypothetical protein